MATTPDSTVAITHIGDSMTPMAEWPPDSPVGGRSYSSPVPVNGTGAYSGLAWVELHFKTQGPEIHKETPNYLYATSQVLPTGPHALKYRFVWMREDGVGGSETPWYDTGWFYVKTPPE